MSSREESGPIKLTVVRFREQPEDEWDYSIVLVECAEEDLWWFEYEAQGIGDTNALFGEGWEEDEDVLRDIPKSDVFVVTGHMYGRWVGYECPEWEGGFSIDTMEPLFGSFVGKDHRKDMIYLERKSQKLLPYPPDPAFSKKKTFKFL